MSEILSWILQITGIVLCGVLIEVLFPKGRLNRTLKSVVAVFIVLVIVSPLKNVDLSNLNFSNIFDGVIIDKDFVELREEEKIDGLEKNIESNLENNGYANVKVNVVGNFSNEKLNIETIFVDLSEVVLSDDSLNINKYTNIVAIIKNLINVSEEKVIFYE